MGDHEHADSLIDRIVQREGGFVNNPADKGGATKYGITQGTLAAWRGAPVTVADVERLTVAEASAIYLKRYITDPGLDGIKDPALRELMVDFGVLSGPKRAIMGLQKALGVTADGDFGPASRAALAAHTNPEALYYKVKCERLEQFVRILADPSQAIFATGWANRLDELQYR